jgi:hypothetical protein
MVDRIPFEGGATRLAGSPVRSDLAVKAPPPSSELPDIAVSEASSAHELPPDRHLYSDSHSTLGEIWRGMEQIQRSEKRLKELEQIRSRLIGHKEEVTDGSLSDFGEDLQADIEAISSLAHDRMASDNMEQLGLIGGKNEASNAAERTTEADRDRVLARIEQAIANVGKLRSVLSTNSETAYDRLINLTSTVNDLNLARTRVDDAEFGLRSASETVDAVMLHMRAAVVAHGKMSPELVRLVLN